MVAGSNPDETSYAHTGEGDIMLSLILGLLTVFLSVCIIDAIVRVPEYHFGVAVRFGRRTGYIYDEGFDLKIPLIDKVELISTELAKIPVHAFFTTGAGTKGTGANAATEEGGKLQMELFSSVQYRPSPHVRDENGRNVFISVSEEVIGSGVADMLEDLLGGLGGIYQADDFIGNRQAFGDLVNQILKFETPFHLRHDVEVDGNGNAVPCKAGDKCKHKKVEKIPRHDLINFYNAHWEVIRDERVALEVEEQNRLNSSIVETPKEVMQRLMANMSPTEKRYGINIEVFALERIDFSEEVKKAFEAQRAAKERQKGFGVKMEMARDVMKLNGASAQEALDAADVSLIPEVARNKRVISVQGKAGVLGGALERFGSDNSRRQS